MNQRIASHTLNIIDVIRDPLFIKHMLWAGLMAVVMVFTILANIDFLQTNYPNPPRPPDRILDWIPQNKNFVQYGEYFSQVQIALVVTFFFASAERLRRLPKLLFGLYIMFILRSFAITLTPLAQITPPSEYLAQSNFIAQRFYHGMFFSGHISSALIQAFFFWNDHYRGTRITWFILPTTLAQAAAMLIAHQHYAIDLFGALFVAYFVLTFDFMKLVPGPLLAVRWMPWNSVEQAPIIRLREAASETR